MRVLAFALGFGSGLVFGFTSGDLLYYRQFGWEGVVWLISAGGIVLSAALYDKEE